eukprot:1142191-Pelagomonas_calceolata.AAC.9
MQGSSSTPARDPPSLRLGGIMPPSNTLKQSGGELFLRWVAREKKGAMCLRSALRKSHFGGLWPMSRGFEGESNEREEPSN